MLRGACLTTTALLSSLPALAADLSSRNYPPPIPAPAAYSWAGLYGGLHAGYGWGRGKGDHDCYDPTGELNAPTCQILPNGADAISPSKGSVIGGQIGYNWQYQQLVFGAEADIAKSSTKSSNTIPGPFTFSDPSFGLALPAGVYRSKAELNWLGTLRLRAGYAVLDRLLIYATGGLAYGQVKGQSLFTSPSLDLTYAGSETDTKYGWVLGGGVEYALTDNWSLRAEGLYYDLGKTRVTGNENPLFFAPSGYQHNTWFDQTGGIGRVAVNYKF
ncbi:outer membrane protein [Bosea sp. MMO-172]|uniref:outer membrane protein n=1 Tax=Bosea sp. MMO-172 TaxID=3127885 RepID=UPI00301AD886